MTSKLNASIPANNWKIIELYNKVKKNELDPSPDFQRKLVWKKQHKFKFIETIILNFPFPEIYIAPGTLDTAALELKDMIVDGQQRCTTIVNYIEGKDVFASSNALIPKFSELENQKDFLNYEVSIRYMKNANSDQIIEIFQRINSTEYSLNTTERLNAKWGDSEFVLFGKQILEEDKFLNYDIISYKLSGTNKNVLHDFFIKEFKIFTENDVKRMLALQYILTLIAALLEGKYFRRNDKTQEYIELYNEEFINASAIEVSLTTVVKFIIALELNEKSYWFNKANIFTLIIELSKYNLNKIDKTGFKSELQEFEDTYRKYSSSAIDEDAIAIDIEEKHVKYYEYSREAVNEMQVREFRGKIISEFILKNVIE